MAVKPSLATAPAARSVHQQRVLGAVFIAARAGATANAMRARTNKHRRGMAALRKNGCYWSTTIRASLAPRLLILDSAASASSVVLNGPSRTL